MSKIQSLIFKLITRNCKLRCIPSGITTKQVFKDGDGVAGTLYLACSDLNLSYERVTTIYQKRWKVEEYHKSIKSNISFAKSPAKKAKNQQAHCTASILAFYQNGKIEVEM